MIPYLLMTFLYFVVAIVASLAAAFSLWNLSPWIQGTVWLRVHFITLGVLTELLFGALPILTAKAHKLPRPKMRWDIWLALNMGIVFLLIGIPTTNKVAVIAGGTLVFTATTLLLIQLTGIRARSEKTLQVNEGRKFYIAGLFFFLIGILVGTGIFPHWGEALGVVGDITEIHIHANNWGFMSLVFVGIFVDLYPKWAKRPLHNPKAITPIFWMMSVGAMALILSPWLANQILAGIGAFLHTSANVWLLIIAIKPLLGDKPAWTAGMAQMLVSYIWLFAPLSMAPFVIFGVESLLPADLLAKNTPQALIYGWLLQFGYAVVPYFFQRFFVNEEKAQLGGTWLSFWLVNAGAIFLWLSIFIEAARGILHDMAYLIWMTSFIPVLMDLWKKITTGMQKAETALSR